MLRVVMAIEAALPAGEDSAAMPLQALVPKADAAELELLDTLLRAADFEALSLFRRLAPSLRVGHGPSVQALAAALRQFDYESARTALQTIRARV
jgi:hypothetical protein